jgi:hypothetical protein
MIVFKNPRDRNQFGNLARQVWPTNSKSLQKAYDDATSKPHGYLFLDLCQETNEKLRFLTNIFDKNIVAYTPNEEKHESIELT